MKDIYLKDLIRAVSDELISSRDERIAANRPAIFEVSELTIEASFVITESTDAGGGFDLKILKADAKKTYSSETINKIVLTLKALQEESFNTKILKELGTELPLRPRTE